MTGEKADSFQIAEQLLAAADLDELIGCVDILIEKGWIKAWSVPEDSEVLLELIAKFFSPARRSECLVLLAKIEAAARQEAFEADQLAELLCESSEYDCTSDALEKYQLAKLLSRLQPPWMYRWCLEGLWTEGQSDKVRAVLVQSLLLAESNLDRLLADLASESACQAIKPRRILKKGEAVERCLTISELAQQHLKILGIFRRESRELELACSLDIGDALERFLVAPYSHFTAQEVRSKISQDTVEEVCGLLLDLVGHRFELGLRPSTYRVISRFSSWFDAETWVQGILHGSAIRKVKALLIDAIKISVQQNLRERKLLECLRLLSADEDEFISTCASISDLAVGEASTIEWLRAGGREVLEKKIMATEAVFEKRKELDAVAELLLHVHSSSIEHAGLIGCMDELELFDASLARTIKGISLRAQRLEEIASDVASHADMKLIGAVGEHSTFNPKLFERMEGGEEGFSSGEVVRPAVVCSLNGAERVIAKGIMKEKS